MINRFETLIGAQVIPSSKGSAEVILITNVSHTNRLGYIHGGVIYSLADIAFEIASNSHKRDAVSISTNMQFHKAAVEGQKLSAFAREIHLGKKLASYEVVVKCESVLIATFTGTVYLL